MTILPLLSLLAAAALVFAGKLPSADFKSLATLLTIAYFLFSLMGHIRRKNR